MKLRVANVLICSIADPKMLEYVRKKKEDESRRKRLDAAEKFRRAVKSACCYSIPWAVAVMEHSCAFLRNLPNVTMPTCELYNEDVVFRQSDREIIGKIVELIDNFV